MTGDLNLTGPGVEVSATLVADGSGNVPDRGDALEVSGENEEETEVTALTAAGNFIATLVDRPVDFDEDATYAAGDVVGKVTVRITHYIELFYEDSANPVTAGDKVVVGTGGARPYDNAGGDTADMITGTAWYTNPKSEGTAGKVAVVRQN